MASVSGKRQQGTRGGFRTKADALRAGSKAYTEYNNCGVSLTPSEVSYADFLDHWMEAYCKTELTAVTCAGYEKRIRNHIKPTLGAYKLSALSTEIIQKFLSEKYHAGYSRNSLVSLKGIISGSLKYAVLTAKLLPTNPATNAHIPSFRVQPKTPSRKIERTIISSEQMATILKRFPYGTSSHLPILLAYRCGLRLGEAYAVFWSDIDFEARTLHVRRQVQYVDENLVFSPPKYGSARKIRLDSYMLEVLGRAKFDQAENEKYYAEHYTHNYEGPGRQLLTSPAPGAEEISLVNVREDGSYIQPRTERHASRIIHYQLGFPEYNFHSLRHTHATMLAERGALPKDIQNRLGHKNIGVTMQIYVHLTREMEDVSIGILEDMPIPDDASDA
ncbi:site-specific integrase [Ruminococcaceae bacterium OttesenSCG-928-D13]|nr:site-specific integrase [Ruminococcaceae bacterium OttesenSCG-928-D13]